MADKTQDPRTPSSDYIASKPYWDMVDAILCGVEKLREVTDYSKAVAGPTQPYANLSQLSRSNTRIDSPYLPRFPGESDVNYETRRKNAPISNIYNDISNNLSGKPFAKELALADGTAQDLVDLSEDIDGQGNNLHVFARKTFKSGIDHGIAWILVDMPQVPTGATLADERAMGARPYWVQVPADKLIAVYSDFVNGVEIITHARIYECYDEREGYGERHTEQVRVFNREPDGNGGYAPATWELWELQTSADADGAKQETWAQIDGGNITIGIIPLVKFIPGARDGSRWFVDAPLKDLAHMQVEEFQQESNLQWIKLMTAYPMLAGQGVSAQYDQQGNAINIEIGPGYVQLAPPTADGTPGRWEWIEPGAQSLQFLRADLDALKTEMRNLGLQPMATANLTVVTTANVSMKAHSAVQAWALIFKDALEAAWDITCQWMNRSDKVTVNIHTDFGVDFEAGTEVAGLLTAETQGVISKRTVQEEFKRRGILSDDFDPDAEERRLAEEQQGQQLQPEKMIDPVTGAPVVVTPKPGTINPPPQQPPPGK